MWLKVTILESTVVSAQVVWLLIIPASYSLPSLFLSFLIYKNKGGVVP